MSVRTDLLWYRMDELKPTDTNSKVGVDENGISDNVLVAVACDNRAEYIAIDSYDSYTNRWANHQPEFGEYIMCWARIEVPWKDDA